MMMVPAGFENFIHVNYIMTIIKPDNLPGKKFRHKAQEARRLMNLTCGRLIQNSDRDERQTCESELFSDIGF
jgi:regulator of extracellular matrix RemA (YlzA/DUF370 family)